MKSRSLLLLAAVIEAAFALWLLLAPGSHLAFYGVPPDMGGMQMGRMFGAGALGAAVAFIVARDAIRSSSLSGILWGGFVFNLVASLLALSLTVSGRWNAMGWVPTLLRLALAAAFLLQAVRMRPGRA